MMIAISSKLAPSDVPCPAVCSSSTIVLSARTRVQEIGQPVGDERQPVDPCALR